MIMTRDQEISPNKNTDTSPRTTYFVFGSKELNVKSIAQ